MTKKVLIIGGGIAGLSTGCYAQMNGYSSEIYEMHSIPGGLCTAWKRKEFLFDGCLHWLTGIDSSSEYYRLWEELGAVQGKTFIRYSYYSVSVDEEGRTFTVYTDPVKLREEMIRIAPEDWRQIDRIIRDIRIMMNNEMPPELSFRKIIPLLKNILLIYKYRKSIRDLASGFSNHVLRNLFILALDWGEMCSAFVLWTLAHLATGMSGYPIGGSRSFIDSIVKRYKGLGGIIHLHSKVTGIIIENNKATGVRLADGTEHRGDIVISAADGHTTIFDWLGGKYLSPGISRAYNEFILFPPLVYVSLGVNGDFSAEPHSRNYTLKKPIRIGPDELQTIFIRNNALDPTFAPPGKSTLAVMLNTNYDYWQSIAYGSDEYHAEKERIGEMVVSALEELYPAIRNQIEVTDIATPHTFVRYTGNWKGSYEGWLLDRKALNQRNLMTLPGLENFYMVGQWVSPGGGLPSGLITSRIAIRKICKKDKKPFVTSVP